MGWEAVAFLGLLVLIGGACVAAGLAIMRGEVQVRQTELDIVKASNKQGFKAGEATGDVLKKVREREANGGTLDRDAVRRLFGGGRPPAGPPGGGAA